jgi:hypothetical protein
MGGRPKIQSGQFADHMNLERNETCGKIGIQLASLEFSIKTHIRKAGAGMQNATQKRGVLSWRPQGDSVTSRDPGLACKPKPFESPARAVLAWRRPKKTPHLRAAF